MQTLVGPRGRPATLSGHPIAFSVLPASQRAGGGPRAWEGAFFLLVHSQMALRGPGPPVDGDNSP